MFNWFKRKTVEQTTATDDMMLGDYPGHVPPRPLPSPSRDTTYDAALYTIGRNEAGMIQLRMNGDSYAAMTLTMNESSVRSLIRQLEAALPNKDTE
jgi:hypothetical protein